MPRLWSLVLAAALAAVRSYCLAERLAFRGPEGALAFLRLDLPIWTGSEMPNEDGFGKLGFVSVRRGRLALVICISVCLVGQSLVDEQEVRNLSDSATQLADEGSIDVSRDAAMPVRLAQDIETSGKPTSSSRRQIARLERPVCPGNQERRAQHCPQRNTFLRQGAPRDSRSSASQPIASYCGPRPPD